jgi:hypothetical protein
LRGDVIERAWPLLDRAGCGDRIIEAPVDALRVARQIRTAPCRSIAHSDHIVKTVAEKLLQ